MAKKARKATAKRGKQSKVNKTKVRAARKTKPAPRKKTKRRAKPRTISQRISSGYHVMVDTVTGTEKLRRKLEKPGTDETE